MIIKKPKEISLMKKGGKIGALVIKELSEMLKPGLATKALEKKAEELLHLYKAEPSFKNFSPFGNEKKYPASLCVSINEEIVHGIPSNRCLKNGDIVSLDLGVYYKGYYTDMACTLAVGKMIPQDERLIRTTKEALYKTVAFLKAGIRLSDIGASVQKIIEGAELSVIRDCGGHGVGRAVHEEPFIPNFGVPNQGPLLKEGMTLAIEPMASIGGYEIIVKRDGWTITTKDKSRSAHFEHTVIIKKNSCQILTAL
jgi:methionyl aminopeptidase